MSKNKARSDAEDQDLVVIREVYDSESAQEIFELELEKALQNGFKTIIIEPTELGNDTSRWITIGYVLRKTSMVTGLASLVVGVYWKEHKFWPLPLSLTSCLCASLYMSCWAVDPCSAYRVEPSKLSNRNAKRRHGSSSSRECVVTPPVVLVKKRPSSSRNYFYIFVAVSSFTVCIWKLY